jgi:hypothetical protein
MFGMAMKCSEEVTFGIKENPDREPTAIMFFAALVTSLNPVEYRVVNPLKNVLCCVKGRGPFKIKEKNGGNVEKYKAYRLIPLTPPSPGHFYVRDLQAHFQLDFLQVLAA